MSLPEPPNPESNSANALLCCGIGVGLIAFCWFMGLSSVLAVIFSGGWAAAGALGLMIALPLLAVAGFVLLLIGAVWLIVRVIADQAEGHAKDRYKDVQR